jgi:ketosteroid isomerase-like protein
MNEHPNATLMREALQAMNAGQVEAMSQYIADDVVWHYIGESQPLQGKDALLGAFGPGNTDWEITTETHDVIANDDHVVALVKATATRDGKTFVYQTAEIAHVKDGKVTERWAFSDDTAAIIEFFA